MSRLERQHPRRLSPEAYAEPNRVVFVTFCAKRRRSVFRGTATAEAVLRVLRESCVAEGLALLA